MILILEDFSIITSLVTSVCDERTVSSLFSTVDKVPVNSFPQVQRYNYDFYCPRHWKLKSFSKTALNFFYMKEIIGLVLAI